MLVTIDRGNLSKIAQCSPRWSGSFRFGVQEGHDDSSAQHGSGGEAHSISPPFSRTPLNTSVGKEGTVHEIQQGEGGEQGDPLPVLFAMGQHQALEVVQDSLQPTETLMAFFHDVCVLSNPDRISDVEGSVERKLWNHARIQVNHGKTQVWNRTMCSSGQTVNPTKCGEETLHCRSTSRVSPFWEPLWSIQLLCKPSSPRKLQNTQLFSRGSLRCKICLLLFCAASRANFLFRVLHPEHSFHFAVRHDAGIRGCLEHIPVSDKVWQMATLQFSSGGLGLQNAERLRPTTYWASWADTLPVVRRRHPGIADHMVLSLLRSTGGFHLEAANVGHTSKELISTSLSGAISTEAATGVPSRTMSSLDSQDQLASFRFNTIGGSVLQQCGLSHVGAH